MATPKIQFSAGALEKDLLSRAGGNLSATARRDLERFYDLLQRSLPVFTVHEARILVHAISEAAQGKADKVAGGYMLEPSLIWAYVQHQQEYYDGQQADLRAMELQRQEFGHDVVTPADEIVLGKGVDIDGLIERLRGASPCQLVAILDAVERVVPEYGDDEDPVFTALTEPELTRVGLIRPRL